MFLETVTLYCGKEETSEYHTEISDAYSLIGDPSVGDASCLLELLPLSCWASLVNLLAAKDLLSLSLSSKYINNMISSMPGIWCQAACSALSAEGSTSSNTGSARACWAPVGTALAANMADHPTTEGSAAAYLAADQAAQQLLSAMTAVACTCQHLKPQLKPQSYSMPPWLGVQPGKSRNLVRVDGGALNPALQLTPLQVHWLSWGCLQGHDGGVFVSKCTSSPRTGRPCGFMAAVVISKQVVAEVYLPGNCSVPSQWAGVLTPPSPAAAAMQASAAAAAANKDAGTAASQPAGLQGAAPSIAAVAEEQPNKTLLCASLTAKICEGAAATVVEVEMWLSSVIAVEPAPVTAAGTASSRARSRRRSNRKAAVMWCDVHGLLMGGIADNAARVKAVRGTAVVPPGTAAASELEMKLAQLVTVGAPILDVRRLQQGQMVAAAAAGWQQAFPMKQQQAASTEARLAHNACSISDAVAVAEPGQCQGFLLSREHLCSARQQWATAVVATQEALTAAVAQNWQQTHSSGSSSGQLLDDEMIAEVLAALVQQLAEVAPMVQVLVLPILLPTGRVGVKLPGGKLSAPHLLSLNVPFLVQLRCAWDRLPCLRQVLLMAGQPAHIQNHHCSMSATVGSSPTMQQQQKEQCQLSFRQLRQQPPQQQPAASGLVRGVFSQQFLEQQWQQQQLNQRVSSQEQVLEQQQQHRGHSAVAGAAPAQVLGQDWRQQQQQLGCRAATRSLPCNSSSRAAQGLVQLATPFEGCAPISSIQLAEPVVLPGSAVEAIHGMVWSCMDRLAPSNGWEA